MILKSQIRAFSCAGPVSFGEIEPVQPQSSQLPSLSLTPPMRRRRRPHQHQKDTRLGSNSIKRTTTTPVNEARQCLGSKASELGDIIDYIKYLQLQIKDLSRSRLGSELTTDPFVFLKGYGHYILHEQMLNEPLEETMGKFLEVNPSATSQLLESRGLVIMPTNLVGLHQDI